ncbi:MAG TPA: hypothetical protein VKC60_14485, partial [Opitutaceae bacterium]|nr:hypothetical protein [Opitutaceae bacterium]
YRENILLSDGQVAVVEVPVFIYFSKIPPRAAIASRSAKSNSPSEKEAAMVDAKALEETKRELARLRNQLAVLKQEFAAFTEILPDGTAREHLKVLIAKMAALGGPNPALVAYNPDGTVDTNIH